MKSLHTFLGHWILFCVGLLSGIIAQAVPPLRALSVNFEYQNKRFSQTMTFDMVRVDNADQIKNILMSQNFIVELAEYTKVAEYSPIPNEPGHYNYRLEMDIENKEFVHNFLCQFDSGADLFSVTCSQYYPMDRDGKIIGEQSMHNVEYRFICNNQESSDLGVGSTTRCTYTLSGEAQKFKVLWAVPVNEATIAKEYFLQNIIYVSHLGAMIADPTLTLDEAKDVFEDSGLERFHEMVEEEFDDQEDARRNDTEPIQVNMSIGAESI